jgi:amidase
MGGLVLEGEMSDEILDLSAERIAAAIGDGSLGAVEVTRAFLSRIEAVNPVINAVCTLNDRALEVAADVDRRRASGAPARPLEGVPFLVKDILQTKGIRTTFGSLLLEHDVPEEDTVTVERLKNAGGVLLGKTNTPEFAHDINTTNKVFGTTRNPWDVNVTAGGSSGGSGAAVASGMAPLALGTDLGGSIRIPCSFNNLAGMRPSPGRVPFYPTDFGWDTLVEHVQGPMTRSVGDVGLALSVMAGPDDRDPSSLPNDGMDFRTAATGAASMVGRRVAYAGDLGVIPLDPEVDGLIRAALARLEGVGAIIEDACFDTSDIREIVSGTRAFGMVARYADRFDAHSDLMTQQLINQITPSLTMSVRAVTRSEKMRTAYWHRVRTFMETFEFIVAPCVGAPPFRLDEPLPSTVGGKPVERFQDVFMLTYVFSVTGLPMAAVPCGLTSDGRPVGMQIVGRRLRDDSVLEAAAAYQSVAEDLFRRPEVDLAALKPVSESMRTPGVSIDK